MGQMTTGVLARRTGLSVKAVREYADAGLIYRTGRTAAGYRLFDDEALLCAEVIRGLPALGLTVTEIRALADADHAVGPRLASLLETARTRAHVRIAELQQVLNRIQAFEEEHRAELSGQVEFHTGNPRKG